MLISTEKKAMQEMLRIGTEEQANKFLFYHWRMNGQN